MNRQPVRFASKKEVSQASRQILPLVILLGASVPSVMAQLPAGQVDLAPSEVTTLEKAARQAGLSNLQISTRLASPGRIVIQGFSARLGEGTVEGHGLVEVSAPSRRHQMKITVSGVQAEALLDLLEVDFDGTVQGRISGSMELAWNGLSAPQVKQTLTGPVRMQAGEGSVSGARALEQAVEATGVEALRTFTFASAQGAGVFRNGRFDVESLVLGSESEAVRGRGSVRLSPPQVALRLDIYLSPSVAASSTRPDVQASGRQTAAGEDKSPAPADRKTYPASQNLVRIPVPVAVTGSLQDPQFTFKSRE